METRIFFIVIAILMTELCERLTFYSISGNMVLFFQGQLEIPTQTSVAINLAFTGISYFIPIAGGWVADSISGRYNAVFGSFLIYFVGAALLPATAFDYVSAFGNGQYLTLDQKRIFYFIGLGLIAIGTGGIKANVSPFGAQQLINEGHGAVQTFFNWFYWFINLGSAIAFSAVVYIQQEISFFVGYIIPACCIVVGLIIFMIPRSAYDCEEPAGSVFSDLFGILYEGITRKRKSHYKYPSFVDYARLRYGGKFSDESVNGIIDIARMLPIFATIVMFWTIYFQYLRQPSISPTASGLISQSAFVLSSAVRLPSAIYMYDTQSSYFVQAERLNIKLGSLSMPVASLNLFNTIVILVATPIVDRIVFPLITKLKKGEPPSMLTRIGFGLVLAATSTLVAGGVEIVRKNDIAANGAILQVLPGADASFNASSISVLVQIPQFMLVGLGEIFTSITALEFAFSEAPPQLRGIIMGLNLATTGLGSFLGSALIALVRAATKPNDWMPDEINNGHYEYFCFLLSGLMLLNLIIYIPIARWYKQKRKDTLQDEREKEPLLSDSSSSVEEKTAF